MKYQSAKAQQNDTLLSAAVHGRPLRFTVRRLSPHPASMAKACSCSCSLFASRRSEACATANALEQEV